MAPLPATDVNMWVPPLQSTGQALANAWPNLAGGTASTSGTSVQTDPNYVRGWNTQTVYEVGTAGSVQTYD